MTVEATSAHGTAAGGAVRPGPSLARRALWLAMTLSSAFIALLSLRFLLAGPEVLYPDASAAGGPDTSAISGHFVQLLQEHWLRFAAHFLFGPIALLVGPFQFLDRLRKRRPALHRRLGWVYVTCVAFSGLAGFALAIGSFGGLTTHIGFGLLAVIWLYSTGQAVRHAIAGHYAVHRDWMVRSFALTFAAVTLRVYIPILAALGTPFPEVYQTVAWLAWVPNLIVAERFFVRGARVPARSAARA